MSTNVYGIGTSNMALTIKYAVKFKVGEDYFFMTGSNGTPLLFDHYEQAEKHRDAWGSATGTIIPYDVENNCQYIPKD